ncbi:MAG TPA: peptidylprolyl isomerase [Bacteroidota bacterium]
MSRVTLYFSSTLVTGLILIGCSTTTIKDQKGSMVPQQDIAIMETSMGTIEIGLNSKETPKTVKNFMGLAEKGYYDGVVFHRVIDNFMIQGGDPTGTGRGGESFYGKKFEDEIVASLRHTGAGILSMANAGPNTNGSQFFITLAPTPWLDGKHTIFGKVVNGMDIVKAIGKVETNPTNDRPLKDVVIKKITIRRAGEGE